MHMVSASPAENMVHPWLHQINLTFVPGPLTPLLEQVASNLLDAFRSMGHQLQEQPDEQTDLILTSASFARPLNWRDSFLFTARRRFKLQHNPTVLTLIHARPQEFQNALKEIEHVLKNEL